MPVPTSCPELPEEVWALILTYLDSTSLCMVSRASTWLKVLVRRINHTAYTVAELSQVGGLPSLTHLQLGLYDRVTEAGLSAVLGTLHTLTVVKIQSDGGCLTDSALLSLFSNNNNLSTLELETCDSLTDASLSTLPLHCPQLSRLHLSWARRLTDRCMDTILTGCHRLAQLSLYKAHNIQSVNAENCTKLTMLSITNCSGVSHVNTTNCPRLTSVVLTGSGQLTDESICQLARNCPGIKELGLSFCTQLTDKSILALAETCHKLLRLDLHGCGQVAGSSVSKLSRNCQVRRW